MTEDYRRSKYTVNILLTLDKCMKNIGKYNVYRIHILTYHSRKVTVKYYTK